MKNWIPTWIVIDLLQETNKEFIQHLQVITTGETGILHEGDSQLVLSVYVLDIYRSENISNNTCYAKHTFAESFTVFEVMRQ